MSDPKWWLAGLLVLPVVTIGLSLLRVHVEHLRRLTVVSSIAMLLATLYIAMTPGLRDFSIRSSALTWIPGGEAVIRIDTL